MFLIPIDPSGSPDPPRDNDDISRNLFVVAGLVIRDVHLDSIDMSIRRLLTNYSIFTDIELHAKHIATRRGFFYNFDPSTLNNLYYDVLRESLNYVEAIIAIVIDKLLFRDTYASNLLPDDFKMRISEIAFRTLIERLLWWNYENGCGEHMILILDDQAFGRLRGQERAFRDFISTEISSGYYISNLPCRKIFPIAAFADSSKVKLIQLADLVTWVIRRVLWRPYHAFLNVMDYWQLIKPKIRKKDNKIVGYGIKFIPQSFRLNIP